MNPAAVIATSLVLGPVLCTVAVANQKTPAAKQPGKQAGEDPAHEELRGLRTAIVAAVEKNDVDALLKELHPDVVVTWLNGEQSPGHKQVRDYYERMMKGDNRIVQSYTLENVEVKELTILYGDDAGVAYGTATSRFGLTDGKEFTVTGPWSATVVKQNGKWLLASFHSSTDMFDNEILNVLKGWIWKAAAIAGGLGLLLGLILMALLKRGGKSTESKPQS